MWALFLQGNSMFYFKLYDDKRLIGLKHSKKIEVVNNAVKLFRKDKPLNMTNRLLSILIFCGIPAFIFGLLLGGGFSIGFFACTIIILNIKLANDETTDVETYLSQVLI